jgi:nucleoside 2-deoxyribosyltransferase
MRVYLASPLGFAGSTRPFMRDLVERLSKHVDVLNPWDDHRFDQELARIPSIEPTRERLAAYRRVNAELARANVENIERADGLVVVLDGVDVDSGTASEIGYAFALGKRIYGLRTDFRLAGDNEGSIVNLQVQYFIEASGGEIHTVTKGVIEAVERWSTSTKPA